MSDFFGIISLGQKPVEKEHLASMQQRLAIWEPDDTHQIHTDEAGLGQNTLWITPESKHAKLPHKEQDLTIVANARIDNRDDLIKQLEIKQATAVIPDTDLILAAYQKWGRDCATKLTGEFSFAIWDQTEQRIFCVKDHVGTRPLYYALTDDYFIFSSEIRGIFATGLIQKELNELMAGAHLFSYSGEVIQTIFKNIYKVPGAHWLSLTKGQDKQVERYWSPSIKPEIKFKDDREYEEGYRELLKQAVKRRTRSAYPIAGLLSGGLDSTAVLGATMKENYHKTPLYLYSWAFPIGEKTYPDDREYVDEFLKIHRGGNYTHRYLHGLPDYISSMPEHQKLCDQPFKDIENFTRFETYQHAQQQGVRVLLSGTGGDELVTNNAAQYVADLTLNFRFLKAAKTLGDIKKVRRSSWKAIIVRHLLLQLYKLAKGEESWGRGHSWAGRDTYPKHLKNVCIDSDFATKIGLDDFIKTHYSNQSLFKPWKHPLKQSLLLNLSYSTFDISFNQRYHLTHSFKMEYAYPLLDKDLLTYYFALPIDQLHKNGQGRSMVRRSVGDYVPKVISKRESKYTASPFIDKHVLREIPWIRSQFAKWKDHPVIAEIIDLEQMEQDIESLAGENMGNFVYLLRSLQLCMFLYDNF